MSMRATSSRPFLLCLLLASGSLSSPRAGAQTLPDKSAGPYVAPGEVVSVTNLDVVVTDGKGNRVTGLKKEDFIVIEDKLEQAVTNFSAIEQGRFILPADEPPPAPAAAPAPAPAVAPTAPQAPKTRLVIFIDNLHLAPANRNRVLRNVEAFVRDNIKDNVEGMIVAWNRSLKIRRKFTNDGRDLSDVLKQIEEESAMGQQILSDRRDVIQAIDDSTTADQAAGRVRSYCESLDNDLSFMIDAMTTTINQLAGVEGRKIVLHVSDGLPQSPGAELWQYISDKYRSATTSMSTFEFDRTSKYVGVVQAANASGVSIYALDASGLSVDSNVSAENRTQSQRIDTFLERNNLQSMLSLMAEETGGEAILNKNDVLGALKNIQKDYTSYYSIGYRSVRSGVDRPHKVEVKLKKKEKGFTVRSRHSYVEKGVETKVREAVTSALFFPRDDNPLAAGLEVGKAVPADRENFAVPVIIRIPYARLAMLPEGSKMRGRVVFYFVVIDSAGKQSELTTQPYPIELDAKKFEALARKDFIYDVKLIMIPGGQKLSIAIRDDITNQTSYLQKSVFISAFAGEESVPRK